MSRRHKKKRPSVPSNPQPKQVNAQTAQELQTATTTVTGNTDSDENDNGSEEEQADAWYCRWYRNVFDWFETNKIIAFGTIFLGLIGIGGLVLTTLSLNQTQQAFEISQQPYVSFGRKDGTIAEFVEPKAGDANANVGLNIYVRNGGRGPALTPNIGVMLGVTYLAKGASPSKKAIQPHPENLPLIQRWNSKDGIMHTNVDTDPIVPDSEYVHYVPDQFTQEQAAALRDGKRFTLLMGRLEYCDEFGNYTCRSIMLYWQGHPFDRFAVMNGSDCRPMYFYPPRQPDQEYLPPCEQPDEREAREEAERKREIKLAAEAPFASPTPTSSPTPK